MAVDSSREDSASDRCAFKEPMLVFTTMLITDPCHVGWLRPICVVIEPAICVLISGRILPVSFQSGRLLPRTDK